MLGELAATSWHACVHPSTDSFKSAIAGKSHLKALGIVLAGAFVGMLLSWVTHWLLHDSDQGFMGLASIWVKRGTPAPFANWLVVVPLGVVYGFYTFEIVLFIFARLLGGRGSFGSQSYIQSLFYGPLALVQQVAVVIPAIGPFLFGLLAAGSLIPTTTSLKAAHRYSMARAVLTWVLPVLLNVVVVAAVVMILIARSRR